MTLIVILFVHYNTIGKVKSIGVSNFNIQHLEYFKKAGLTIPSVNQIEIHPFLVEGQVVDYCKKNGILIQAYSPIAQAKRLDDPVLVKLGKKYNKTAAQIMLKWSLQNGFITLPKSTTKKRIIENGDLFDFELTKKDFDMLAQLAKEQFRCCWNVINTQPWDEKHFVSRSKL